MILTVGVLLLGIERYASIASSVFPDRPNCTIVRSNLRKSTNVSSLLFLPLLLLLLLMPLLLLLVLGEDVLLLPSLFVSVIVTVVVADSVASPISLSVLEEDNLAIIDLGR